MDELQKKIEAQYGLVLKRTEVMELMKIGLTTIKRWENEGKIIRIPNQGKIVKFSSESVAKLVSGH